MWTSVTFVLRLPNNLLPVLHEDPVRRLTAEALSRERVARSGLPFINHRMNGRCRRDIGQRHFVEVGMNTLVRMTGEITLVMPWVVKKEPNGR